MKKYISLLLAIGLAITLVILGCGSSSKDPAVAVVNGEEIPVSMIHKYFDEAGYTFNNFDEELAAKRAAVDSVIDYKLLIKGAYEAGLANDPEIDKVIKSKNAEFLFDAMYRKDVMPSTEVTEREIRDFYDRLAEERRVFHILVATKEQADSIATQLKNGQDFGVLARTLSLDQSSAVSGGDLGWMSWGANIVDEFREEAFRLSPGSTSEPIKTEFGYHIIRVTETRPVEMKDFAELSPYIRQALIDRKASKVEGEFISKLQEKAGVEINPDATAMLMEKLDMYYPDSLNNARRPDNYFPNLELLKPFEQQTVLASYTGGEVTVEGYINKIASVAEAARPRFDDTEGLKRTIFQLELKNILEYEAQQRKIQESDEYLKRINDFREGLMVDKFVRQVLGRDINVSEDEVVEYYNTHLDEFTIPQEYHVQEIMGRTAEDLGPVMDQVRSGADFANLAANYSQRPGAKNNKGDLGYIQKSRFPALWEAAKPLTVGKVSDIVPNDEGTFSIIRVLDIKQPVIRPVEQVATLAKSRVVELRRSSASVDWIKQAREKAKIEIFANVLEETIDKSKYANKG